LTRLGYKTEVAINGRIGAEKAKHCHFPLILMGTLVTYQLAEVHPMRPSEVAVHFDGLF